MHTYEPICNPAADETKCPIEFAVAEYSSLSEMMTTGWTISYTALLAGGAVFAYVADKLLASTTPMSAATNAATTNVVATTGMTTNVLATTSATTNVVATTGATANAGNPTAPPPASPEVYAATLLLLPVILAFVIGQITSAKYLAHFRMAKIASLHNAIDLWGQWDKFLCERLNVPNIVRRFAILSVAGSFPIGIVLCAGSLLAVCLSVKPLHACHPGVALWCLWILLAVSCPSTVALTLWNLHPLFLYKRFRKTFRYGYHLQQHCCDSARSFGYTFEEVHRWLDESAMPFGPWTRHCEERHTMDTLEKVRDKFGEQAVEPARQHITADHNKER